MNEKVNWNFEILREIGDYVIAVKVWIIVLRSDQSTILIKIHHILRVERFDVSADVFDLAVNDECITVAAVRLVDETSDACLESCFENTFHYEVIRIYKQASFSVRSPVSTTTTLGLAARKWTQDIGRSGSQTTNMKSHNAWDHKTSGFARYLWPMIKRLEKLIT